MSLPKPCYCDALKSEVEVLKSVLSKTLTWIKEHAGWEYGFSVEELERLKAECEKTLSGGEKRT